MPNHLFVYGTLQTHSPTAMAARLRDEAKLIGAARAEGRLYDLGGYPGAIFETGAGDIAGEVFELADAEALLAVLDEYEGLAGVDPVGDYARISIDIFLLDGRKLEVWSYALVRELGETARVHSGNWRGDDPRNLALGP